MNATLLMFQPKCSHCGEALIISAQFCVQCGKPSRTNDTEISPSEITPLHPGEKNGPDPSLPSPPSTDDLIPLMTKTILVGEEPSIEENKVEYQKNASIEESPTPVKENASENDSLESEDFDAEEDDSFSEEEESLHENSFEEDSFEIERNPAHHNKDSFTDSFESEELTNDHNDSFENEDSAEYQDDDSLNDSFESKELTHDHTDSFESEELISDHDDSFEKSFESEEDDSFETNLSSAYRDDDSLDGSFENEDSAEYQDDDSLANSFESKNLTHDHDDSFESEELVHGHDDLFESEELPAYRNDDSLGDSFESEEIQGDFQESMSFEEDDDDLIVFSKKPLISKKSLAWIGAALGFSLLIYVFWPSAPETPVLQQNPAPAQEKTITVKEKPEASLPLPTRKTEETAVKPSKSTQKTKRTSPKNTRTNSTPRVKKSSNLTAKDVLPENVFAPKTNNNANTPSNTAKTNTIPPNADTIDADDEAADFLTGE